ncbi:MAG: methyltransferase domain-containing protein [Pseudomonadota bacterium]
MRTDVVDIKAFYDSPLGRTARGFIRARLTDLWGHAAGLRIAGYGYAEPYVSPFADGAERILALHPASQGVAAGAAAPSALVEEAAWPLADAAIDRIVIAHGLEEAESPHRVLREAWRALTDDGRLVLILANRRSLWALSESTPFGAGRPFSTGQITRLLKQAMFGMEAWSGALYMPPVGAQMVLRAAPAWERAGGRLWPGLGGVLLIEATKQLYVPSGRVKKRVRAPALLPAKASAEARRGGLQRRP